MIQLRQLCYNGQDVENERIDYKSQSIHSFPNEMETTTNTNESQSFLFTKKKEKGNGDLRFAKSKNGNRNETEAVAASASASASASSFRTTVPPLCSCRVVRTTPGGTNQVKKRKKKGKEKRNEDRGECGRRPPPF